MSFEQINLDPRQLLSAVYENLDNRFYTAARHHAKQLFQTILEGGSVPFMQIKTAATGTVTIELQLDHSEHVGPMSFSHFRKCLAMLMLSIKHHVDEQLPMNPLFSDNGDVLFNVPGVLEEESCTNVLVSGLKQLGPGRAAVTLMYLNPNHFLQAVANAAPQDSTA